MALFRSLSKLRTPFHVVFRCNNISTTAAARDLMEFFDDKKNWGAIEVRSGRAWTKDDLRIKSNCDLHKLWYVLLKERNMLLTMEQECKDKVRLFPSPERLDKVEISMENLEEVVKERNRAYYELETGKTGLRPTDEEALNMFGLPEEYKMSEHSIPKEVNGDWQKQQIKCHPDDIKIFIRNYKEKEYIQKKREERKNFRHVVGLLNRFPKMDMEALKEQYPDVDIEKAKESRKYKPPPVFD